MKHIFMLSILLKSHLIKHSGTGRAFKDTQRTLEYLRHSGTWALGEHSEGTRALRLSDTSRALRNLEGTRALGGHSGTRALKVLGHSDT